MEGPVGSRTLSAGRTAQRRHDQLAPRRPAWTSRTVSGRGARACAGGLFTASRWPCVWLCSVGRARGRWRARAGRFSAESRTRARGRTGVGGDPPSPAAHGSASLRAPWPPGSVLGLAQGRPQLPGLARRGGPGPRGPRAGGGWSRTSAQAGRLGLVRSFSRGDECQAFHRGGLRSPPRAGIREL